MLDTHEPAVIIELAGQPRGKGRPRFNRKSGHAYTPEMTENYEASLRWAAQTSMTGRKLLECPVNVIITATMPIAPSWAKWKQTAAINGHLLATGRPDVDNIMKMLDAFNNVVWKDDSQIIEATVRKVYGDRPGLNVLVLPRKQATR